MVNKCCICGSSNSEASLFSFPKHEQNQIKWKEFAGIAEDKISTSKICHKHFKDDEIKATPESTSKDSDGTLKKHRRRLIPNAVPSLKFDNEGSSVGRDSMTKQYCLRCKTTDKRIHFTFPENLEKRTEWLRRCGYTPDFYNGDKKWYLCAKHFSNNAIMKKTLTASRNRLCLDAVPTLFMTDTNNELSTVEGTASNEITLDYSLFPTKILPATSDNIVFGSSSSTSEIISCTPDTEMLILNGITEVTPLSSSSSTAESCIENELIATIHNIDSVREIHSNMSNVNSSVDRNVTPNDKSVTPPTCPINSIHDYISPSTINKILALHKNSNCEECIAFERHIHNSLNDSSQPQITPVPHQASK